MAFKTTGRDSLLSMNILHDIQNRHSESVKCRICGYNHKKTEYTTCFSGPLTQEEYNTRHVNKGQFTTSMDLKEQNIDTYIDNADYRCHFRIYYFHEANDNKTEICLFDRECKT